MVITHTKEDILRMLSEINDPEIPVVNIIEMGMVRDVRIGAEGYEVLLTPTYSGCPAMGLIGQDIKMTLEKNGVRPATVKLVYDPAWTTDWITNVAREKMRHYGISPPLRSSANLGVFASNMIECPRCYSKNTVLISRFGATACKALYQCNDCKEPFEYFKCH